MKTIKLYDVYMNLPRKEGYHVKIRDRIVFDCKISTYVFYNWINGITIIPPLAKPIIANILELPESELFTDD
jgi:hypothetical protein